MSRTRRLYSTAGTHVPGSAAVALLARAEAHHDDDLIADLAQHGTDPTVCATIAERHRHHRDAIAWLILRHTVGTDTVAELAAGVTDTTLVELARAARRADTIRVLATEARRRDHLGTLTALAENLDTHIDTLIDLLDDRTWSSYFKSRTPSTPHTAILALHPDPDEVFGAAAIWGYGIRSRFLSEWIRRRGGTGAVAIAVRTDPNTTALLAAAAKHWHIDGDTLDELTDIAARSGNDELRRIAGRATHDAQRARIAGRNVRDQQIPTARIAGAVEAATDISVIDDALNANRARPDWGDIVAAALTNPTVTGDDLARIAATAPVDTVADVLAKSTDIERAATILAARAHQSTVGADFTHLRRSEILAAVRAAGDWTSTLDRVVVDLADSTDTELEACNVDLLDVVDAGGAGRVFHAIDAGLGSNPDTWHIFESLCDEADGDTAIGQLIDMARIIAGWPAR